MAKSYDSEEGNRVGEGMRFDAPSQTVRIDLPNGNSVSLYVERGDWIRVHAAGGEFGVSINGREQHRESIKSEVRYDA